MFRHQTLWEKLQVSRSKKNYRYIACVLILPLALSGCASMQWNQGSSMMSMGLEQSVAEEIEAGRKIHQQIVSTFYVYTEPEMVAYINSIGDSIIANADRQELPYKITLLYDEKIYATSAPGGHVYLTTALINFLDNEAELAAVIAHEIGQLQYRDPRFSKSRRVVNALTEVGAMVAPAFGAVGSIALLGLLLANATLKSQILDAQERLIRADRLAMHYLVDAGYDPQGMLDVIYKFLNADEHWLPYFYDYYQARPITDERFAKVQEEFADLPLEGKSFHTNRNVYLETTKGIREIYTG